MNLTATLRHLYPSAVIGEDIVVVDRLDGNGPRLETWKLPRPQPTQQELETAWAAVQAVQAKQVEVSTCRADITTKFMALTATVRGANLDGYYSVLKALDDGLLDAARERIKTLPIDTVIPAKTVPAVK